MRQVGYGVFGLVLLTMGLVACGPARMSTVPERAFPYRVTDGTAELLWDCTRTAAGEVRIEGVANNPFFPQPIKDVQRRYAERALSLCGGNLSQTAQSLGIAVNTLRSWLSMR